MLQPAFVFRYYVFVTQVERRTRYFKLMHYLYSVFDLFYKGIKS